MRKALFSPLVALATVVYVVYLVFLSLSYSLFVPFFLTAYILTRRGRLDDAFRCVNALYGAYMLRGSWPLIRIEQRGLEHVPRDRPCLFVANHHAFIDVFFFGLMPMRNIVAAVRSWPFRLWVLGRFMRWARYIDMEGEPLEQVAERACELTGRGVCLLFFPEGHRSRDGRLQRFHSGAFRLAAALDLPVVPVCLSGSQHLNPSWAWRVRPARITIEILPPVQPSSFPPEKRALQLRRRVESLMRGHFGEPPAADRNGRRERRRK